MKKLIFISILMAFVAQLSAQVVNIPDAVFKSKLKIYDTNNNGEIEVSEGLKIDTLMDLSNSKIKSLTGIEKFTNLRKLNFSNNQVTSFDFITLAKLEYLVISGNMVSVVSIINLPNLKFLEMKSYNFNSLKLENLPKLEYLECGNYSIKTLDFNNIVSLKYLIIDTNNLELLNTEKLVNLEEVKINSNNILKLDLSKSINLKKVSVSSFKLSSMSLKNCTKLEKLYIIAWELKDIELGILPNLTSASFKNINVSALNFENFANLENLTISGSALEELSVKGLEKLVQMDCSDNNIKLLNVSGTINLKILDCSNNEIKILNLTGLNKLTDLDCSFNKMENIEYQQPLGLIKLQCVYNLLSSLDLQKLSELESLSCSNNVLLKLDLTDLVELRHLSCNNNKINTIKFKNNDNLTSVSCDNNLLKDISNLSPNVRVLDCSNNLFTTFVIKNRPQLVHLTASKNKLLKKVEISNNKNLYNAYFDECTIDSLLFTNNLSLNLVSCKENKITSLTIVNCQDLTGLNCESNELKNLNITGCNYIQSINCGSNLFETLDFGKFIYLEKYEIENNQILTYLNLKNGSKENLPLFWKGLNKLTDICCDDNQIIEVKAECNAAGLKNININSDCEGGRYLLTGKALLDINNNGCDDKDILFPNSSLDIVNGLAQKRVINDASGKYSVILPIGTYDVMPSIEKSDYFKCKTQPFNVVFPVANSNMISKDICITPIGNVSDLEIVLIPINGARPGFVSDYQIIVKNNGNSYENPTVNFFFDGNIIKFEKSDIVLSSQSSGKLAWSLSNIIPLETRLINFSLRLNKPTDIPAVNGDDILLFNVNLSNTPNDVNTYDNYADLSQTVVNSFDPNDKTCLEGDRIELSKDGNTLHYMIRFENTGSANAENIVVRDQIDTTKFILKSLEMVRASHNCTTEINQNGLVEFLFNNIQLPFTEPDKHGYILFKIKTKPNLPLNDSLKNQAKIYFDFNFPIVTNVAKSALVKTVSTTQFELSPNINLFPNPANEYFNLNLDVNKPCTVNIFDQYGRMVLNDTFDTQNISINTSWFNNGVYFVKLTFNGVCTPSLKLVVLH